MKRTLLLITLPLLVSLALSAEEFRGNVVSMITVDPDTQTATTLTGGDLVAFALPESEPFVDGFELRVEIPEALASMSGIFGLQFFADVDPPVQSGMGNVTGRRLELIPLTAMRQQYLRLPIRERGLPPSRSAATTLEIATTGNSLAFAVQLVPLMKGMGAELMSAEITVTLYPVLAPVGGLTVDLVALEGAVVTPEDLASLRLLLNDEPIPPETIVELDPGIYHVSLESDAFVNVDENVGIEAGHVSSIALPLEPPMAEVRFSLPSTAELFIDGLRVPRGSTNQALEPGEHTMLVRLGDFSVSRRVFLQPEEEYEIGVELDFFVRTD